MTKARIDVESSADLIYLPWAKALLYRAKEYLKTSRTSLFARHYEVAGIKVFIKVWPGGEYIKIRAGALGDYLVYPFVKKISTAVTTSGPSAFLNGNLKTITEATDFPNALSIRTRVSQFQHQKSKSKKYTGATDPSPDVRGYFVGQLINDGGNVSFTNYGGAFRHEYTDAVANPLVEFIHAKSQDNAVPSTTEGLYYQTSTLGDQLTSFSTDFPGLANRPAVSESMFASPDGTKVVAEEQFLPGNPYGFSDYEIIRSIIDIDLGNVGTEVVISDKDNLNGYPASTFEAQGSGSLTPVITAGSGDPIIDTHIVTNQQFEYPVGSAFDINNNLIHSNIKFTYDYNETKTTDTTVTDTLTVTFSEIGNVDVTVTHGGEVILDESCYSIERTYGYTRDLVGLTNTPVGPYVSTETNTIIDIGYIDVTLPAIIYKKFTETSEITNWNGISNEATPRSVSFTQLENQNTQFVLRVGQREVVIASHDATETVTNFGVDTLINIFEGVLYRTGTSEQNSALTNGTTITLPSASWPHRWFRQNRNQEKSPGLTRPGLLDPDDDEIYFAAQDRTHYIGTLYAAVDATTRQLYTFSNNDARLKETIVNFVLSPAEPITGAALDDYEIWFTAIRAI